MTNAEPARALEITYRPATSRDLVAAARLHAAADVEMTRRMHPVTGLIRPDKSTRAEGALAALRALHEEEPRQVWVAISGDQVTGLASAAFRGRHAHIQSFFVAPAIQQRGIGEALLQCLHDAAREAACDLFTLQASDDPRALSRYFRLGLRPQAPNIVWSASDPHFPALGLDNPFEPIALSPRDAAALNTVSDIDRAVRGVSRISDLQRWLLEGASGALLVDRQNGVPAGYFLILSRGSTGRIGPVAAMDEPRFADVLRNALAAAGDRHRPDTIWRIAMPGDNQAAVAPLLAARFRPTFAMTFFASEPIGQFDRYAFHDLDLL